MMRTGCDGHTTVMGFKCWGPFGALPSPPLEEQADEPLHHERPDQGERHRAGGHVKRPPGRSLRD